MSSQTETTKKFIKDARTVGQRVDEIERLFPPLIQALGRQLDEIKAKSLLMEELVDTAIGLLGTERFAEALKANRLTKAQEDAEQTKAETQKLKVENVLVPVEQVADDSIVVISSFNTETGAPVGAGWFRFRMQELKPEFQQLLKGQSVGFSGQEGPNTFTVLEILKVNKDALKQTAATNEPNESDATGATG